MSVLSKEDLLSKISARIGDDNSDEAIQLLEDFSDTMADMESRVNGDGVDWHAKYDENDKMWRDKYKQRFMSGETTRDDVSHVTTGAGIKEAQIEDVKDDAETISFDDLFTEREG